MMKSTTITCLLSALCSATCVLADALPSPASSPEAQSAEITPTPLPILEADENTHLEVRQNQNANLGVSFSQPSQAPTVTTHWFETTVPEAPFTTYVEVIYTQAFSSIPDQWPSAGQGQIGYGTLKATGKNKTKRDAMPEETGIAGRIRI
ncbi:hypothetical protein KC363_g2431 [Hortaea werneckii]|uniref:Uncharacterized protein n=1 Tax=Hortaea werneckii TaxID=91943 RepID=A0A3M7FMI4_HORWE|nr:hypothetical protein KC361_g4744 [Hortaea werneckii]KAI6884583.1 hypothetical protein KC325_g4189 [Hortaea werneckii]KAI6996404.1 hypothetical protein KC359_g3511 [Hortaea werneckii]KAI7147838.1 hypothetical protein KC344_g2474 [Hortaea werneckii]KAI7177173.1 hypothetical protein KC360_g2541 [Hortaea werneckii]